MVVVLPPSSYSSSPPWPITVAGPPRIRLRILSKRSGGPSRRNGPPTFAAAVVSVTLGLLLLLGGGSLLILVLATGTPDSSSSSSSLAVDTAAAPPEAATAGDDAKVGDSLPGDLPAMGAAVSQFVGEECAATTAALPSQASSFGAEPHIFASSVLAEPTPSTKREPSDPAPTAPAQPDPTTSPIGTAATEAPAPLPLSSAPAGPTGEAPLPQAEDTVRHRDAPTSTEDGQPAVDVPATPTAQPSTPGSTSGSSDIISGIPRVADIIRSIVKSARGETPTESTADSNADPSSAESLTTSTPSPAVSDHTGPSGTVPAASLPLDSRNASEESEIVATTTSEPESPALPSTVVEELDLIFSDTTVNEVVNDELAESLLDPIELQLEPSSSVDVPPSAEPDAALNDASDAESTPEPSPVEEATKVMDTSDIVPIRASVTESEGEAPAVQTTSKPPESEPSTNSVSTPLPRSSVPKDKERTNYASFDCGALIVASNPDASSATSILHAGKDKYMLNRCGADKFLIVELCDTIRVDTVMLSNFEYFSSMFKEFKLFTKEFPPKTEDGWLDIGTFRAENVRENQFFKIERPAEFTKVIKLVFISHYGSEYYCPLTNLRVYGTTQMEEYIENEAKKAAEEKAKAEGEAASALKAIAKAAVKDLDEITVPSVLFTIDDEIEELLGGSAVLQPISTKDETAGTKEAPEEPIQSSRDQIETRTTSQTAQATWVLAPDSFRNFMSTQSYDGVTAPTPPPQASPSSSGSQSVSEQGAGADASSATSGSAYPTPPTQESVFITFSKRLAMLERNATLSHLFIEEQARAYSDAFRRVETMRAESVIRVLAECNRTITMIVKELARDYESAWGYLLRELERDKKLNELKLSSLEASIAALSDKMNNQFFYNIALVLICFVLLGRVFSAGNLDRADLRLNPFSPASSPKPASLRFPSSPFSFRSRQSNRLSTQSSGVEPVSSGAAKARKQSLSEFATSISPNPPDGPLDGVAARRDELSNPSEPSARFTPISEALNVVSTATAPSRRLSSTVPATPNAASPASTSGTPSPVRNKGKGRLASSGGHEGERSARASAQSQPGQNADGATTRPPLSPSRRAGTQQQHQQQQQQYRQQAFVDVAVTSGQPVSSGGSKRPGSSGASSAAVNRGVWFGGGGGGGGGVGAGASSSAGGGGSPRDGRRSPGPAPVSGGRPTTGVAGALAVDTSQVVPRDRLNHEDGEDGDNARYDLDDEGRVPVALLVRSMSAPPEISLPADSGRSSPRKQKRRRRQSLASLNTQQQHQQHVPARTR